MTPVAMKSESEGTADRVFEHIAEVLRTQAWCVIPDAFSPAMTAALAQQDFAASAAQFNPAGVGRQHEHLLAPEIRGDNIQWIAGTTPAEQAWLQWADALRLFLNRRLFMGLDSFESHFAHYAPGACYRKHRDAFRDAGAQAATKRVLSVVAYFNADWGVTDGGELVIYDAEGEQALQTVLPLAGTLVVFLSEEVPHEVCVARRDRYSIAGWYRSRATANPL